MAKQPKNSAAPNNTATATAPEVGADGKKKRKTGGVRKVVKKIEYVPAEGAVFYTDDDYEVVKNDAGEDVKQLKDGAEGKPLVNEDGKYLAVPADYNPKIHKPLKRGDFQDETLWFELTADALEKKAKRLRAKAEELKKFGGKDRVKAKKLLAMQKRFLEFKKSLASSGLNVDEILASMQPDEDEDEKVDADADNTESQAAE